MDTLASEFEEEHNVTIFPEVENFWEACTDDIKSKVLAFIQDICFMIDDHEILCVMQWIELQKNRSSIVFYVMNRSVIGDERFRFIISFHAPEYRFYSQASNFRTCLVRDKKWHAFAESLMKSWQGINH
jgi:hypothetical protein